MIIKDRAGSHGKSTFKKIVIGLTGGIVCLFLLQAFFFAWLWSSLTPAHKVESVGSSDLIVVFSGDEERIQEGYALARAGRADNLLITGHAEVEYQKLMKKFGTLPTVDLIPDGKSRSTFEDVHNAKKVILENEFESIVLVTSTYHLPRVLFLFKTFLSDTGRKLDLHYHPVAIRDQNKKLRLCCNEIIKFWGSTLEMIGYAATDSLLLNSPFLARVQKFCQKRIYFQT